MSVFTSVSLEQLNGWLAHYPAVGEVTGLQGITAGITNTNYFVDTPKARYVLTLFEHNRPEELPYYLRLMAFLAERGVLCPGPVADVAGGYVNMLNGKPAALVSCLKGAVLENPQLRHCREVGAFLARLHWAGRDYPAVMPNPRGAQWRAGTASKVMPKLNAEDRALLADELAYQAGLALNGLPQGVIHADLFRDNVLFENDALAGAVDFYYACNDALAYDLAIAANDWCTQADGALDAARVEALLQAYQQLRPLSDEEKQDWHGLLRAGALRFWLSRLHDYHFPQPGEKTFAKDPAHFRKILQQHRQHPVKLKGH
jgi:homoserine kinase type II